MAFGNAPKPLATHASGGTVLADRRASKASMCGTAGPIAAITSCTNTSNPSRNAGRRACSPKRRSSAAAVNPLGEDLAGPGSRVVSDYLEKDRPAALSRPTRVQPRRIWLHDLHRQLRAAARRGRGGHERTTWWPPPCFPATAISRRASIRTSRPISSCPAAGGGFCARRAGGIDLTSEPIGIGKDGATVYLQGPLAHSAGGRDRCTPRSSRRYSGSCTAISPPKTPSGTKSLPAAGNVYAVGRPAPTSRNRHFSPTSVWTGHHCEIKGARPLGIFGDSVTTDHISPAGSIKKTRPAGKYLLRTASTFEDFNS